MVPFFDPWSFLAVLSVGSVMTFGAALNSFGEWWLS
jgi:hypothetical protein